MGLSAGLSAPPSPQVDATGEAPACGPRFRHGRRQQSLGTCSLFKETPPSLPEGDGDKPVRSIPLVGSGPQTRIWAALQWHIQNLLHYYLEISIPKHSYRLKLYGLNIPSCN